MKFKLPFDIRIESATGCGGFVLKESALKREVLGVGEGTGAYDEALSGALTGIEALLLALAQEGIDLADVRYHKATRAAVDSVVGSLNV